MVLRGCGASFRWAGMLVLASLVTWPGISQTGSSTPVTTQSGQPTTQPAIPSTRADGSAPAPSRRSSRRARRRYVNPATATQTPAASQTVAPDAAQRTRDAQILAAQKAQSAEIARQNAITTGNVVRERQAQQAEPRIQDAPGPGSQPLAGDPAIQPKAGSSDPQGIQDAPGPAQTLPQAPPARTTAPPAPQQTAPQS
jgi:hypothetical protein